MIKFFFLIFLVPGSAFAEPFRFLTGGAGPSSVSVFGSNYKGSTRAVGSITGSLLWGFNDHLALRLTGEFSPGGEYLFIGSGLNYYFKSPAASSGRLSSTVIMKSIPNWVFHVGATFGINRIQLSLERSDGTQTDVVLAGLVGPTLYAGTMQSFSSNFYIDYELLYRYAIAANLGASEMGATIQLVYALP